MDEHNSVHLADASLDLFAWIVSQNALCQKLLASYNNKIRKLNLRPESHTQQQFECSIDLKSFVNVTYDLLTIRCVLLFSSSGQILSIIA